MVELPAMSVILNSVIFKEKLKRRRFCFSEKRVSVSFAYLLYVLFVSPAKFTMRLHNFRASSYLPDLRLSILTLAKISHKQTPSLGNPLETAMSKNHQESCSDFQNTYVRRFPCIPLQDIGDISFPMYQGQFLKQDSCDQSL